MIIPKKNNKIIIVGNGGSASIAAHAAVDFTKVLKIRSITFNESNLITCFANDYGYENWVKKAIEFYALKGDILILISSSGKSQNLIKNIDILERSK
jgi:D-sedoheptulose 7-phosphate isomerase